MLSQQIAPAGIGETSQIGGVIVAAGGLILVEPQGIPELVIGTRVFASPPSITLDPGHVVDQAACEKPPLFHILSGDRVFVIGDESFTETGTPEVVNSQHFITPNGANYGQTGLKSYAAFDKLHQTLAVSVCSSGFSPLPHILGGGDIRDALLLLGYAQESTTYGRADVSVPSRVVLFSGVEHSAIGLSKLLSFELTHNLDVDLCGNRFGLTHVFPPNGSSLLFVKGGTYTQIDTPELTLKDSVVNFVGETHTHIGLRPLVGGSLITHFFTQAFCSVLPGALQHALGIGQSALYVGLDATQFGDVSIILGAPKRQMSGLDYAQYGDPSLLLPQPRTFTMTGPDTSIASSGLNVVNKHQFLYPTGLETSDISTTPEVTNNLRFIYPTGVEDDELEYGNATISNQLRYIDLQTLGDTLITGGHRASYYIQEVSPLGDVYNLIGVPFIFIRVLGAGDQSKYGQLFIRNDTRFLGPTGLEEEQSDFSLTNRVELAERTIPVEGFTWDQISQDAKAFNLNQFVGIQPESIFSRFSNFNLVELRNKSLYVVPLESADFSLTNFIGRNPNQALPDGLDASRIGDVRLQYGTRSLGMYGYTYPTFTPGLFLTRQIVIRPNSTFSFRSGNTQLNLPDRTRPVQQVETLVVGGMVIGDYERYVLAPTLNRTEEFGSLLDTTVFNQFERVLIPGLDTQLYGAGYVEERFTLITPHTPQEAEFGVAQLVNRNRTIEASILGKDEYGQMDVALYTRYITPEGLVGTLGGFEIKDALQTVFFNGEEHANYGVLDVYLGSPNLPVNQSVYPQPFVEALGQNIGSLELFSNPHYVTPLGENFETTGEAVVAYQGAGIGSLNVLTRIGAVALYGGGDTYSFEGKDFAGIGGATIRPDRVYMTRDFEFIISGPSPYPGTDAWYAPGTSSAGPQNPDYYNIGSAEISLFNRRLSLPGTPSGAISLGAEVSIPEVDRSLEFFGSVLGDFPYPSLFGGVRIIAIAPLPLEYADYGVSFVHPPLIPPISNENIDPIGGESLQMGSMRVEFFNRELQMSGAESGFEAPDAWLSFSPRFLDPGGTESPDYGLQRASFYVQYLEYLGEYLGVVDGFSAEDVDDMMRVLNELGPGDERNLVFSHGVLQTEYGLHGVQGGSLCDC